MATKLRVEGEERTCILSEEADFFRLSMIRSDLATRHVEDFLDTTVEWLSTNPEKGILIDFKGVKSISEDFAAHLLRYYEEIKARGLYVRFVNVAQSLESSVDASNITVVISPDFLRDDKPHLSAREILQDLANNVTDRELMVKHGLSEKGLKSMFRKLLQKGLITKTALAKRWGGSKPSMIVLNNEGKSAGKIRIDPRQAVKDIFGNMSNAQIMKKYKLSERGLNSLLTKLHKRGLISTQTFTARTQADSH
ncbi:MAG: STAS domain-containing protein [Desulfomonile sp.]|nr:STAS domain-containing protein [Desulfomonile sp.]